MEKLADNFVIALIQGKQYLASTGAHLLVDRIDKKEGQLLEFKDILLSRKNKSVKVGAPVVAGALLETKIVRHTRGKKGTAFRYRSKKRIRVSKGFRADLTELIVTKITN